MQKRVPEMIRSIRFDVLSSNSKIAYDCLMRCRKEAGLDSRKGLSEVLWEAMIVWTVIKSNQRTRLRVCSEDLVRTFLADQRGELAVDGRTLTVTAAGKVLFSSSDCDEGSVT